MMRSLYSAISGLKNHQVKMDVIGNNIANVNTTGFKRSRVTFSTMLSQTIKGASSPSPNQGGTNPMQVGLGALLGSIDQVMTQGSSQSTGKSTDLMLQGTGFFVMNNAGQTVYTRAGGFGQDYEGTLEDPATGAKVQGYAWGADDSIAPVWNGSGYGDIKFDSGDKGDKLPIDVALPVTLTATTEASVDWSSGPPSIIIHAALIGAGNVSISGLTRVPVGQTPGTNEFTFDPTLGTLTLSAKPTVDVIVNNVPAIALTGEDGTIKTFTVSYPPAPGATVYVGTGPPYAPYTLGANPSTLSLTEYAVSVVNGKYQMTFGTAPVAGANVGYDFTNKPHTLNSFSIDQSGVITGVYSNGDNQTTHKIAQIAVAKFANDAGLENVGGSFYMTTNNSGTPDVGSATQNGRASIVPTAVEMSNVDLSQEFTDMIVAQRGFQANSRVITVSDSLLQELIDLKRQ